MEHPQYWNCVYISIPHQVKTQRGKNTREKASPKFSLPNFFVCFTYCRAKYWFFSSENWRHSIFFCHVLNMLKMKKALHDHIFPLQKCEQLAQQVLSSICIIYCKMYIISLADSKSTNTSINPFMNPYVILDVDGLLLQQDVMLNNWCRRTVANSLPFSLKKETNRKKILPIFITYWSWGFFIHSLLEHLGVLNSWIQYHIKLNCPQWAAASFHSS